jgi:hypothetical protein
LIPAGTGYAYHMERRRQRADARGPEAPTMDEVEARCQKLLAPQASKLGVFLTDNGLRQQWRWLFEPPQGQQ